MEELKAGYMKFETVGCTKCHNQFKPEKFPTTADDCICPACKMLGVAEDARVNSVLATELTLYAELKLWTLQKYVDKWVTIHGDKWEVWCCFDDAIKYGYMTWGLKPFLCKKIVDPADRRNMVWL
jgi:hypothetical protein